MNASPRVLLFTGDGKGKTTAALGMALRACGHGQRVCMVQFIKGNPAVGELSAAEQLPGLEIVQTGLGFVSRPDDPRFAAHQHAAEQGLVKVREAIAGGQYSMVILDEVCVAVAGGLLREQEVIDVLREARPEMSVVLTGRGATPGLIALADTVSEIRNVKHGYQAGRPAQKGVEL